MLFTILMISIFSLWLLFSATPNIPLVNAKLNIYKRQIKGTFVISSLKSRKLYFWTYPNRYKNEAPYVNDLNRYRIYPIMFDSGYMQIQKVFYGDKPLSIKWFNKKWMNNIGFSVNIPGNLPLGKRLLIKFKTKIPKRYGPFGCINNRCILGAPWYPIITNKDQISSNLPIKPFLHSLKLSLTKKSLLFLFGKTGNRLQSTAKVSFFPALAGRDYKRRCYKKFCIFHHTPVSSFFSFITGDNLKELIQTTKESIKTISQYQKKKLWLLEAPLREELAMPLPGSEVLFAHKAFHILKIDYFLNFHRNSIKKVIYESVLSDYLKSKENPMDMEWIPSLISSFLAGKTSVNNVLKIFNFIPQVDVIIKNPRMEFKSSFVSTTNDSLLSRDDYRKWNNSLPSGVFIKRKLLDIFCKKGLSLLISRYLKGKDSFRVSINKFSGNDMSWFFKLWLGKHRTVNYSISKVKRIKTGNKYLITVRRHGDKKISEPVYLTVLDENNKRYNLSWFAKGSTHEFRLKTTGAIEKIVLDPDERLIENSKSNPLYDNYWPSPGWRFIFSGFEALFNITEMMSNFRVDADILPKYSLKKRFNILLFRDELNEGGFNFAHLYYFGQNINNTRLKYRWDTSIEYGRSRKIIDNNSNIGRANRFSLITSFIVNNRQDFILPTKKGYGIIMGKLNYFNYDDNLSPTLNLSLNFNIVRYFSLPWGMSLAAMIKGDYVAGKVHSDLELAKLTGPGSVQGYSTDEFPGRASLSGSVELRHILKPDFDLTLLGLSNMTRLSGALYLSTGIISGNIDGKWYDNRRVALAIGYGIRVHGKWFGIYEGIINFQVAKPLIKYSNTKNPYIIFVSLEPTF